MGLEKKSSKDDAKTPKPKRTMSEAQKEALAKGRAKAHERMRGLKTEKEEIKSLKQKVAIKAVDEEGEVSPLPPTQVKEKKAKPKKQPPPPPISDDESEESEEEPEPPKKSKKERIIEKHYYHDKPTPTPPPSPAPAPAPAPRVSAHPAPAPAKKKISFR